MKISLVGLSGCGKTSIYSTTFGGLTPKEITNLGPTIMYEVRNHTYLGLEVSLWDFGGQEQYRQSYIDNPKVLTGTSVLILVLDLHQPDSFAEAEKYFIDIYNKVTEMGQSPRVYVFYHKYDTESYSKEQLESNLDAAKSLNVVKKLKAQIYTTSVYKQEQLSNILREILIEDFDELKASVEHAEKHLANLKSRVIVTDMNGNVITHNVPGFSSGLSLREDLRDFIVSCDNLRENFFSTDSAQFFGNSDKKKIIIHIFNYILSVLIIQESGSEDSEDKIEAMLTDLRLFADLAIATNQDD